MIPTIILKTSFQKFSPLYRSDSYTLYRITPIIKIHYIHMFSAFKSHKSAAGCWNIKQAKSTHVLILNVFEGECLMSLMFHVHLK